MVLVMSIFFRFHKKILLLHVRARPLPPKLNIYLPDPGKIAAEVVFVAKFDMPNAEVDVQIVEALSMNTTENLIKFIKVRFIFASEYLELSFN